MQIVCVVGIFLFQASAKSVVGGFKGVVVHHQKELDWGCGEIVPLCCSLFPCVVPAMVCLQDATSPLF